MSPSSVNSTNANRRMELGSPHTRQSTTYAHVRVVDLVTRSTIIKKRKL